ncbi:trypsin-like peptidase domain-containing protein [Paraconexibacter antarcticus]|uniref:Trypsin-like peptidase domain-containing protein n=1 Tax=Paraconexibacter antarcticus TaxID=2949664 RepID=A0ABY5DVI9_9ACTN|nr:trypsin-like peptidase domain-containing protein [Paraconexibacter antarcticus]UTI64554.1 trypsin-like peptidase domain-containing protein [Paraconexibacter antarcticus]
MTTPLSRPAAAAAAIAASAALLAAGCGGSKTTTVTAPAAAAPAADAPTTKAEAITGSASFSPEAIYKRESPGVVTIISAGLKGTTAGKNSGGLGSGFVISSSGEVATNAHVVTTGEGGAIREAARVYVKFDDGNEVSAKVVGFDPFADVALLKIDPSGLDLKPLPLGSTKGVKVGAPVAAIGSPFGEEQSLSIGVISATGRSIDSLTGFSTSGAIQTDAAINHGNSGGPLLDAHGAVLGINSQIQTESGDGTGVGFAVPVDAVKHSLDQLRRTGKVSYAYLGVSSRALYPQVAEHFKLPVSSGVWVQTVPKNGPAAAAGIRAGTKEEKFQELPWIPGGDIIVGVDGTPVKKDDDLAAALVPYKAGDTITLKIYRDGKPMDVKVKLGERPLTTPPSG